MNLFFTQLLNMANRSGKHLDGKAFDFAINKRLSMFCFLQLKHLGVTDTLNQPQCILVILLLFDKTDLILV